jgi:hypothetical protein
MMSSGSVGNVTRDFARTNAVVSSSARRAAGRTSSRAGRSAYASSSAARIAACCWSAVGVSGVAGAPARPREHLARGRVHLRAGLDDRRVRATTDLGSRERRHQCVRELFVVERRADPELALGVRHELGFEPLLVRLDRRLRRGDRALESCAIVGGQ